MAQKIANPEQNEAGVLQTDVTDASVRKSRGQPAAKPGKKPAAASVKVGTPKLFDEAPAAAKKSGAAETKASIILKKLNSSKGTTVQAMIEATGWQAHSVRGFLSAVIKKKLALNLISETGKDGVRRYRIATDGKAG